ncbi:hypothetical protein [Chitinophaga sp. RAB17]|uniref:hypothetical protein n=1 Tax=Chitinophaga sp. RAB17 TaxID=3233049 RepID=UPI003F93935C
MTVEQALQNFYKQHNYGAEGGINEKYAWIKFGFFSIPVLNIESRRKNVYLHDINHIITGYDTTWKGESAISAWEIASGGWKNIYVIWIMALWAIGLGVLFYPGSTLKAFKQGLTMKNAVTCGLTKTEMYQLPVADLRNIWSNRAGNNNNPFVWMAISLCVFALPFVIGTLSIWIIITLF